MTDSVPKSLPVRQLSEYPALLSRKEAAEFLRVHVKTISRMVQDGRLKAHDLGGTGRGPVRIPRDALVKLLSMQVHA